MLLPPVSWADGNINVDTLRLDLSAGDAGVSTYGTNNTIRAFHATGDHSLSAYVANHNGDLDVTLDDTRSSAGLIQFVTAGDLTLTDGSSLTFDEREDDPDYKGTVLFASTDGAFINEAGAGVFGGATRFVIYSSTTAATKKGGLVGTLPDTFNHAYDLSEWFDDNDSRFFFTALSGSPILTYKADSLSRSYGAENPTFTFTRTGLIESVIDDVTGTPSLSSSATQSSGVGAYTISIGLGTLSSSNYDFQFQSGTLTIERAPLTITANDKTRRVNLENPDFDATFAGFVLDQDESVLGGTLTFATPATSASPAGSYAITPSGLTSANYEITFVPGVLTVTNFASLLITANNASRTYGAANPTFTASYSGFVDGDRESVVTGLQFSTTATQSSGIGNYTITPFGASADGYEISYAPGTLTIERAPLTISIPNQSRLYGDENDFTINFNGLVNDETSNVVSGLLVTSAASKTSDIGTYAIEASGATADNYSITYSPGMLTITPAPLTVSIDPATRRYGDPDPVFTYTVSGLKNNDSESLVTVNNLASLASANAGIGAYGIVGFPFVSSSNYSVAEQVFGTLTITPRLLTIRADNATRVYGDANPTFTASVDGLASFDTPALFGDIGLTTQATQTSGVGEWGITFGAVANQNYTITREFGTLTITPAPLIFDALLDVSRLYGRTDPTLVMPAVGGLKNDDTVAGLGLSFTGVPEARADAGSYTYSVAATNPNYTFTAPTATFRIDPAPLTVAIGSTGRVYGDENPTSYDLRVTGLAFDDTATSVIGVNNPTEARTDIGTYAVTLTLLNYNYVIESFTGGNFVISPRLLTFTAADRTKVYGDVNPFFYGTITGFAEGDSELGIVTNYGFTTDADLTSSVGTYYIRPTAQTTTPNYVATFVDGALTVTPAQARVTIANASRAYGQANPVFTVTNVQGLKNNDTVDDFALTLTSAATGASDVGFYTITGSSQAQNYSVVVEWGTLSVTRALAEIAGGWVTRVFGPSFAGNPFTPTYTGFLETDEAIARNVWTLDFEDESTFAPGRYEAHFGDGNDVLLAAALRRNYDIVFLPGILDVTARPVVVRAPDMKLPFGTKVPETISFDAPEVPAGGPEFTVGGHVRLMQVEGGSGYRIVPFVVPGEGVTQEELDRYYQFQFEDGPVSFQPTSDNIDLTTQLDPSKLNTTPNTIYTDVEITEETVEVNKGDTITVAANPYVDFDTKPLTPVEYASYFGDYFDQADRLRTAMDSAYQKLLSGKGKADSDYEQMSPEARALLDGWMDGSLSAASLQSLLAAGDAAAINVFSLMLPSIVELTREKSLEEMTVLDRQVLGRLADLTEQRRSETVRIAQQKYKQMLEENGRRAESSGLATLFMGPGDFQNIVESARQEAMSTYVGATVGAAVGTTAALAAVLSIKQVLFAIFPATQPYMLSSMAAAGPAIVVSNVITLAMRAVQISESIQNEQDFNNLMKSWANGQQITSIADLQSSAMDSDIKLSTMMLSLELLNASPTP